MKKTFVFDINWVKSLESAAEVLVANSLTERDLARPLPLRTEQASCMPNARFCKAKLGAVQLAPSPWPPSGASA